MRKYLIAALATGITLGAFLFSAAPAYSQVAGSLWKLQSNSLFPVNSTWGITVPSLSNLNCIGTNGSGVFGLGTCGSGSGGLASSTASGPWTPGNVTYVVDNGHIGSVATSSVAQGTGITISGTASAVGANGLTITNSSPLSGLSTSFPLQFSGTTLSWIGLATSTNPAIGGLTYWTGLKTIGSIGTTSVSCSGSVSCAAFTVIGVAPITITGTGAINALSTTTPWTPGQLAEVVSNSLVGGVSTSTLTASSPLTGSFTQIGSGGSLGCQTASDSQAGCLSAADHTLFNSKLSTDPNWLVSGGFLSPTTTIPISITATASSSFIGPILFGATTTQPYIAYSPQSVLAAGNGNTLTALDSIIIGTSRAASQDINIVEGAGAGAGGRLTITNGQGIAFQPRGSGPDYGTNLGGIQYRTATEGYTTVGNFFLMRGGGDVWENQSASWIMSLTPTGLNIGNTNTALVPINRLEVTGNAAIGTDYADIFAAPTNGLLIEGNVGIGTTSPYVPLAVSGNVLFGGTVTATSTATSTFSGPIQSTCFSTDGSTCITGGGGTNFFTNSGVSTYLSTGTNLGVGTTSPYGTLGVGGNLVVSGIGPSVIGTPFPTTPTVGSLNSILFVATSTTLAGQIGETLTADYEGSGNTTIQGLNVGAAWGLNATSNSVATTNGGGVRNRYFAANNSVGFNVGQMTSVAATISVNGTFASTTDGVDFQATTPVITSSNLLTNYRQYWARAPSSILGTITNEVGFNVESLTAATNNTEILLGTATIPAGNFGIYQSDTKANSLAGNLGLGTTTPGTPLSIGSAGLGINLGTGTSTFTGLGGINLITGLGTAGCFAINGVCVGAGGSGTVTSIATNNGITGGTITTTGTIGLAAIAANSVLANLTGGSAVPTALATSSLFLNASATNTGLLTSTDWSTFNGKYSPVGTTGQFPYFSASNTLTATSSIFLATSSFVGIGTTTPIGNLSIQPTANNANVFNVANAAGSTVFSVDTTAANPFLGVGSTTPWATVSLVGNGTNPAFAIAATSTVQLPNFEIDNKGHLISSGPVPTISSCGTSSFTGKANDQAGEVGLAGTALTACTVTFAQSWAAAPVCTVSDNTTASVADITSISTTQIVFGLSVGVTSANLWYQCQQTQ